MRVIATRDARRGGILWLILLFLLCLIGGTLIGEVISLWIPQGSAHDILTRTFAIGFGPAVLNMEVFSVTFGLSIKFNGVGIVLGLISLIVGRRMM
jgi:hypothetical protein